MWGHCLLYSFISTHSGNIYFRSVLEDTEVIIKVTKHYSCFFPLTQLISNLSHNITPSVPREKMMAIFKYGEITYNNNPYLTIIPSRNFIIQIIFTQLYGIKYSYLILIFFKHPLIHEWDPNRYYHSWSGWNQIQWQWSGDSILLRAERIGLNNIMSVHW